MPGAGLAPGDAAGEAPGEAAGLEDAVAVLGVAVAPALADATGLTEIPGLPEAGLADTLIDGDGDGAARPLASEGGATAVSHASTSADTMPTIPPAR